MRTTQLFRRLIAATISAGAALVLTGAAPAHASDAPPPPIVWERISAYHSGLVLAVPPPYTQNDLQVVQQVYNPNATAAQWKTKPVGPQA